MGLLTQHLSVYAFDNAKLAKALFNSRIYIDNFYLLTLGKLFLADRGHGAFQLRLILLLYTTIGTGLVVVLAVICGLAELLVIYHDQLIRFIFTSRNGGISSLDQFFDAT